MDKYLSPHPQGEAESKRCRESGLLLEPSFTEDLGSPYSINMSLLLPEATYLHPGLCRPVRPIKTEPLSHSLIHSCQGNGVPPIPEYPGVFSTSADTSSGNFFIKQEMPSLDFQEIPFFQLLNSDLEQLVPRTQVNSELRSIVPMTPLSLPFGNLHLGPVQNTVKPISSPQNEGCPFPPHLSHQQRPAYLPPSPPSSEPGSPDRGKELLHNLSPPPSYEVSVASKLTVPTDSLGPGLTSGQAPVQSPDLSLVQNSSVGLVQTPSGSVQTTLGAGPLSPVLAQSAPVKYNRRNNPDLERRRIHHCDVPGEPALQSMQQINYTVEPIVLHDSIVVI